MCSLYFLSTNTNKYIEIHPILHKYEIDVKFLNMKLREIQGESLSQIAVEKSKDAFKIISKPVIVEDDGLLIQRLNGFPGSYSSFVFKTIGSSGILKLLSHSKNRSASFVSVFVYNDGNTLRRFLGKTEGRISSKIAGAGWGYDPIFIPTGSELSFGQLKDKKFRLSHRTKAITAFARWFSSSRMHKHGLQKEDSSWQEEVRL
ncbi:MAG TPA: RdgB/HAM1 family non-canonical purine NTP pyrophosphatase [Candidatus Nitrosopolaris sp.]|nr:RdgB/HAM1 family non-canonical purine NTP pyrophosphatase [Candidatus Nitrosopolaris sp.]